MCIYIYIYIYPSSEEAVRSNLSTCRWALDPTGGSLPDEVRCAFRQVVFYGWVLPTDPAPAGQISHTSPDSIGFHWVTAGFCAIHGTFFCLVMARHSTRQKYHTSGDLSL